MVTDVVGRHLRPRYHQLRRTVSDRQPWSRRRRTYPIALDALTDDPQVAPSAGRRRLARHSAAVGEG